MLSRGVGLIPLGVPCWFDWRLEGAILRGETTKAFVSKALVAIKMIAKRAVVEAFCMDFIVIDDTTYLQCCVKKIWEQSSKLSGDLLIGILSKNVWD